METEKIPLIINNDNGCLSTLNALNFIHIFCSSLKIMQSILSLCCDIQHYFLLRNHHGPLLSVWIIMHDRLCWCSFSLFHFLCLIFHALCSPHEIIWASMINLRLFEHEMIIGTRHSFKGLAIQILLELLHSVHVKLSDDVIHLNKFIIFPKCPTSALKAAIFYCSGDFDVYSWLFLCIWRVHADCWLNEFINAESIF